MPYFEPGLSRRQFVLLGGATAAAMALGGCVGDDDTAAARPPAPSASGSVTRTVQHAKGELAIPAVPSRVVTCEGTMNLIALGFYPVGARNLDQDRRSYPEFADELGDIVDLGGQELDLEEVLALEPDLIIAGSPSYDDQYAQMTRIAPTVMEERAAVGTKHRWDQQLAYFAEVLGRDARAAELMNAFNARRDEFKAEMGERLGSTRISVMRVSDDSVKIFTKGSFSGGVLDRCGIRRPPQQDLDPAQTEDFTNGEDSEGYDISTERLREADADVIFLCVPVAGTSENDDEDDAATRANAEALTDNPLWEQLGAVQSGQAFRVGSHWDGDTILDAEKVLDDLFRLLLTA